MISVNEKDRDVLRFLWVKNIQQEPPEIQVLRFTRVAFGVASSPFLLNATISHHLEGYMTSHEELIQKLQSSIYVDDVISGAEDPEAAYQFYLQAREILKEGGFNLRKFKTSDPGLQNRVEQAGRAVNDGDVNETEIYAKATLFKSQKTSVGEQKTLGIRWKVDVDELVFDLSEVLQAPDAISVPTKRHAISIVGRIYDPLGILSPVVILFKIYFKELCIAKVQWDEPLPEMLEKKRRALIDGLRQGSMITLPRCLKAGFITDSFTTYQLCGFGDASCKAYAAVVYLLIRSSETAQSKIICSKSRVAPAHELTIPRLELLSALLLAKLIDSVTQSLKAVIDLELPLCFLDSKVAFYWICGSDRSWRPFVQNRVSEIRQLVPSERWRHCPGTCNPADAPSRGQTFPEFVSNESWFNGPEWLLNLEDAKPPVESVESTMPVECTSELKKTSNPNPAVLLGGGKGYDPGINNLINIKDFSDINRLLRLTAHVLLFIRKAQKLTELPATVTAELLGEAEGFWIRAAQATFETEPNYTSLKGQSGLFIDPKGLIRC